MLVRNSRVLIFYPSVILGWDSFSNNFLHTCVSQLTAEDAFKLEDRVEASMIQLQADLHEAKSRNIYLNDLVEEQKRQAVILNFFL